MGFEWGNLILVLARYSTLPFCRHIGVYICYINLVFLADTISLYLLNPMPAQTDSRRG